MSSLLAKMLWPNCSTEKQDDETKHDCTADRQAPYCKLCGITGHEQQWRYINGIALV